MATGPLMAIGAVDMLIPPSALTVLLGSRSGISISKLLIGRIVPGLLLSVTFIAYIVLRVVANPSLAPRTEVEQHPDARARVSGAGGGDVASGVDRLIGGFFSLRPWGFRKPAAYI